MVNLIYNYPVKGDMNVSAIMKDVAIESMEHEQLHFWFTMKDILNFVYC